jgi:hypothetical protein
MKNKTLKNLIAVGIFVFSVFSVNFASAYMDGTYYGYNASNYGYYNNYSNDNYAQRQELMQKDYYYQQQELALKNQLEQQKYAYEQQKLIQQQNLSNQRTQISLQPYTYVSAQPRQQIQYVTQPVTQVQYVPQQQTVSYVNTGSNLGASVVRANTTTKLVTAKNSGTVSNSGQYINFDNNSNQMASAYGVYGTQQIVEPVVVDTNGVTALSVNGSGSFMPSSVFQWFLLILLILAIIIIARMISKSLSKDPHGVPAH